MNRRYPRLSDIETEDDVYGFRTFPLRGLAFLKEELRELCRQEMAFQILSAEFANEMSPSERKVDSLISYLRSYALYLSDNMFVRNHPQQVLEWLTSQFVLFTRTELVQAQVEPEKVDQVQVSQGQTVKNRTEELQASDSNTNTNNSLDELEQDQVQVSQAQTVKNQTEESQASGSNTNTNDAMDILLDAFLSLSLTDK